MTLFIITFLIINQLTGLLVDNKQVPLGMGLDYYHQVDIISKDFNVVVYQYNAGVELDSNINIKKTSTLSLEDDQDVD